MRRLVTSEWRERGHRHSRDWVRRGELRVTPISSMDKTLSPGMVQHNSSSSARLLEIMQSNDGGLLRGGEEENKSFNDDAEKGWIMLYLLLF